MQVPIADIKVRNRIRKDLGDISSLAESLKKFGQINPIVISKKNVLIAGERRLEAARSLNWKTINVVIADVSGPLERLEYEVEENIQRRAFSPQEEEVARSKLQRLRNPGFLRRIWNAIVNFIKRLFRIEG